MKKMAFGVFVVSAAMAASVYAYEIAHPNLRDAAHHIDEAIVHINKAYEANGGRGPVFGGHAEEAEKLLGRAKQELEEADRYRMEHQRR
jgi:hypothetical protein